MELLRLDEPFPAKDIEWRAQQVGISGNGKPYAMVLAYVTNRAIMARLDEVCGKACWRNEYAPAPAGGLMCGISIKVGDEWITKWDGAENTQVEAVKGGMSGAMKRAAVQWGIGRYLYNLEEGFAQCSLERQNGWNRAKAKTGQILYWTPPQLPAWALPSQQQPNQQQQQQPAQQQQSAEVTPEKLLKSFENHINKLTDLGGLKDAYKSAWDMLSATPDAQKQCQRIYQTRAKQLQNAA